MSFSTMYIASTGMLALGTGMQTISNNLANVNTVGFKTMRTNYEDLISQCYISGGNHNQVGRGAKVSTIQSMFTQGAFMGGQQDTDLAIAGEGFFNVRTRGGDIMYTRAGVYSWKNDGSLQDPSGNILQGWQMSVPKPGQAPVRLGSPTDIKIASMTAPPLATTTIRSVSNLNADDEAAFSYPVTSGQNGQQWEGDGFAAAWDPTQSPPIDKSSYTYSEPLTVYDSLGNAHNLMAYYQKNPHMDNVWDYIVTADPKEDARPAGAGGGLLAGQPASYSGLIQKGKITFTGDDAQAGHGGLIKSLEAQNIDLAKSLAAKVDAPTGGTSSAMQIATIGGYYTGSSSVDPATGQTVSSARTYTLTWGRKDPTTGNILPNTNTSPPMSAITWEDDLGNIGYIPVSDKSYPGPYAFGSGLTVSFGSGNTPLDFGALGDAMTVTAHSEQLAWANASPNADGHFDLNLAFVDTSRAAGGPPYPSGTPTLTQTVSLDLGAKSAGGGVWIPDEVGTTQYASQSITISKDQDGYPESSLERVYVREDGLVVGVYGQKREEALYQVCLTRFLNPWGLDKKGDNLFAQSRFSGDGFTSAPGEGGAGTVLGNFLEQSNVDTATEIVQMILTQRGFQANSKAITTSDTMIATAIQVKK